MNDPFALIAIIVSISILPAFLVILFWTIRRVAHDHRDQVERCYGKIETSSDTNSIKNDEGNDMSKMVAADLGNPAAVFASAETAYTKLEHSHNPATFDKVLDEHEAMLVTPAVILATRRSMQEETSLFFPLQV